MTNYLVSYRGTLATATIGEIFTHTLAVVSSSDPAELANDAEVEWREAWDAGTPKLGTAFPGSTIYTEVVAAEILKLEGGEGALHAGTHKPFTPNLAGLGTATPMPAQCAVAVSLEAGTYQNGVKVKGRFYLPTPHSDVLAPTGIMGLTYQTVLHTGMVNFLAGMEAKGHVPCVWSRSAPKHGGGKFLQPVEKIRVGDRVDTVRRRRNARAETYMSN